MIRKMHCYSNTEVKSFQNITVHNVDVDQMSVSRTMSVRNQLIGWRLVLSQYPAAVFLFDLRTGIRLDLFHLMKLCYVYDFNPKRSRFQYVVQWYNMLLGAN